MRQRSFIVVAVAIAVLILGAVGVYAYDKTQSGVIAHGVTAGGVDLGGMHRAAAERKLQTEVSAALGQPLVVSYGHRRFTLSAHRAGLRVNTAAMVQQALDASQKGNILSRAAREITGGSVNAHIPVDVSYSHAAVTALVARVRRNIDQAPQDASIDFSSGSLSRVQSHYGRKLDTEGLTAQVEAKLTQPGANRTVAAPVAMTKPKVTTRELARQYPTVITINRSAFRLTLYKNLKPAKTYTIAVGMQGLETPAGRYNIQDKQVDPSWHVPNSAWAGKLAGQVIPPGPQDPIKARWMGIANGAGIHGTEETGSLGTAGSHGCIRMAIPDVIELFDKVSVGDPVFIA